MIRALRIIVTAFRVAALALFVIVLGAWVESYVHDEIFSWVRDSTDGPMLVRQIGSVRSARGGVQMQYTRAVNPPSDTAIQLFASDRAKRGAWRWDRGIPVYYPFKIWDHPDGPLTWLGFEGYGWKTNRSVDPRFGVREVTSPSVTFPYWFAALVLCAITIPSLRRTWTLRRRQKLNLCIHCGYDVRATPGRCPECGTEVKADVDRVSEGGVA